MINKWSISYIQFSYESLANAIIIQAMNDYKRAVGGHNIENMRARAAQDEIEHFFLGEWIKMLTKLDGEWLMETACRMPNRIKYLNSNLVFKSTNQERRRIENGNQ